MRDERQLRGPGAIGRLNALPEVFASGDHGDSIESGQRTPPLRKHLRRSVIAIVSVLAVGMASGADATPLAAAAARVVADRQGGRPLVAHVWVALCDNAHQGIVPVPGILGDGADADRNLYWGARFGVRTYFKRMPAWKQCACSGATSPNVLQRVAFSTSLAGSSARLFVVADAWRGDKMREMLRSYLAAAGGAGAGTVIVDGQTLQVGGAAHVVAFVGHDGLMDWPEVRAPQGQAAPPRAAIVLACLSRPYFSAPLRRAHASLLLLTNGLMAPEAYTLEAALRAWFETTDAQKAREAAARAYDRFQKCGLPAARKLFAASD